MGSFRRVVGGRRPGLFKTLELGWTAMGWRGHLLWRRGPMHLDLIKPRSTLLSRRLFRGTVIWIVFPFTDTLWRSAARPLVTLTSSHISSNLSRRGRWSATGDAWCCGVGVMLVWRAWTAKMSSPRRGSGIADQRSNLGLILRLASVGGKWRWSGRCRHAVDRKSRRTIRWVGHEWWPLYFLLGRLL